MNSKPLAFTTTVSRNALIRREAYPPRKSLVPQANTEARAKLVGTNCAGEVMLAVKH
jgi:hypothetical protein